MKSNLLSDGTSKIRCTYVNNNVKTTGTWNSLYMLQQVTAGPAQALVNSAVSLHRTRTVNITFSRLFFCSRYMTKHISPPVVEEVRCPRDIVKHTHSHTSERCLATALRVSASITTGQYVLNKDVDPKRLGSENNAMKEAQQARTK